VSKAKHGREHRKNDKSRSQTGGSQKGDRYIDVRGGIEWYSRQRMKQRRDRRIKYIVDGERKKDKERCRRGGSHKGDRCMAILVVETNGAQAKEWKRGGKEG
jgi:hypothetical protein